MNNKFKKIFISVSRLALTVLFTAGLVAAVAHAGSITAPVGSPSAQSYTLSDIYNKIKYGTTAVAGNHSLSPTTTPQSSFHSLTDVYNSAVSLANMWNGTCNNPDDPDSICSNGEFPGGSQSQGGVDDFNGYNLGGARPTDSYHTTWTKCTLADNNYCGTGDDGAQVKDNATGLIWSYQCKDEGCVHWDKTDQATLVDGCLLDGDCSYWNTDAYYTWDASGVPNPGSPNPSNQNKVGNGGKTAWDSNSEGTPTGLCNSHPGWSLPHQKQLMQAYIDGSYGNIVPEGVVRWYWSSTVSSFIPATSAWSVGLSYGYAGSDDEANQNNSVICVRES